MTALQILTSCVQQFYGRAYESPIEERLAWALSKLLAPGVTLRPQVECPTPYGKFRADLVLATPTRSTILECDGREFHTDRHRDHVRDLVILHAGHAQQVLRFQGEDLYGSLPDLIATITLLHPDAFDHRGRTMAARGASPEMATLTALDFQRQTVTTVGGTQPGRRYRSADVTRHALADQADPLLAILIPLLQDGTRRSFRELVTMTEASA